VRARTRKTMTACGGANTLAWKSQAGVTRASYEAARFRPRVADVYVADQHPRGEGTVDVSCRAARVCPRQACWIACVTPLRAPYSINHDLQVESPHRRSTWKCAPPWSLFR
jgi:hypothetical protein